MRNINALNKLHLIEKKNSSSKTLSFYWESRAYLESGTSLLVEAFPSGRTNQLTCRRELINTVHGKDFKPLRYNHGLKTINEVKPGQINYEVIFIDGHVSCTNGYYTILPCPT